MGKARPTVERRQLGLMLRRLREASRRSQAEAANEIGKTSARLSQVETGVGSLSTDDLVALLDFLQVGEEDRQTALALGLETRKRQRRRGYTDLLPGEFVRLADLEADAVEIRGYDSGVIPGLIQSPGYVQALISACNGIWWDASEAELSRRVDFRLDQQKRVLDLADPKQLDFVFTEDALDQQVGGRSVMRGQIAYLLQLIEQHPSIEVRIVPTGPTENPVLGGGVLVLDFTSAPRIAFATTVYGPAPYFDDKRDTDPLYRAFSAVRAMALDVDRSRALLISRLEGLY